MPDYALPMAGGCRCDRVRFEITAPPMMTLLCHCTGCQRMSGSAYSTTVMVPTDGFRVTKGEVVIGGIHGDQGRHHHCDWCKSWMFTTVVPEMGFTNVRATLLDDAGWFAPFAQTYTSEGLAWAVPAGVPHSYAKFPEMADFPKLLAEFAAR